MNYARLSLLTLEDRLTPMTANWLPTTAGTFDWFDSFNWSDGIVPSGDNVTAYLSANINGNQTITLNREVLLRDLHIGDTDGSHTMTLVGNGTLNFVPATNLKYPQPETTFNIYQIGSNVATIATAMSIAGPCTINVAGKLTIQNSLVTDQFVMKTGLGELVLDHPMIRVNDMTVTAGSMTARSSGESSLTVNSGSLYQISGNNPESVTLNPGSRLSGTGSAVTLAIWGEVSPGNTSTPIGTLYTDRLDLNSGSQFIVDVSRASTSVKSDLFVVRDHVSINGATLEIRAGNLQVNDTFVIINQQGEAPVDGTFAGLEEGAIFTSNSKIYRISYRAGTRNDIAVTLLGSVPVLTGMTVNDSALMNPQFSYSRIVSIGLTFNVPMILGEGAIRLSNEYSSLTSDPGGGISVIGNGTSSIALLFQGSAGVEYGSLSDGKWMLEIDAERVFELTYGHSLSGGDRLMQLVRYFGDSNGDSVVSAIDLAEFNLVYGPSNSSYDLRFDSDGDMDIDVADQNAINARLNTGLHQLPAATPGQTLAWRANLANSGTMNSSNPSNFSSVTGEAYTRPAGPRFGTSINDPAWNENGWSLRIPERTDNSSPNIVFDAAYSLSQLGSTQSNVATSGLFGGWFRFAGLANGLSPARVLSLWATNLTTGDTFMTAINVRLTAFGATTLRFSGENTAGNGSVVIGELNQWIWLAIRWSVPDIVNGSGNKTFSVYVMPEGSAVPSLVSSANISFTSKVFIPTMVRVRAMANELATVNPWYGAAGGISVYATSSLASSALYPSDIVTPLERSHSWYIDPVHGNDSSIGTDPTSAWRTIQRLNFEIRIGTILGSARPWQLLNGSTSGIGTITSFTEMLAWGDNYDAGQMRMGGDEIVIASGALYIDNAINLETRPGTSVRGINGGSITTMRTLGPTYTQPTATTYPNVWQVLGSTYGGVSMPGVAGLTGLWVTRVNA